jgi:hypothetical protein
MRASGWIQELQAGYPRECRLEELGEISAFASLSVTGISASVAPLMARKGAVNQVQHPPSAGLQMQLDLGTLGMRTM